MKTKNYHTSNTILPISWDVDYNKHVAFVTVRNIETNYNNTTMVDYRLFSFDHDLSEATLNIALMDEVQKSFNNEDKFLEWLIFSEEKGLIEPKSV